MSRLPVAGRRAVLHAAGGLLAGDRRAVVTMLVLHVGATVAGLAPPWLLGRIVDAVLAGAGAGRVDRYAVALLGCAVAQGLLSRYAQYAGHRFGERAVAGLRERFVEQVLRLPVGVVERADTGDLATRSSVDVSTVGATVRDVLPVVTVAAARLSLLFGAIFLLDWRLGLAALAGLPPILAAARWYLRRAGPAYLAEGAATADLTETLVSTAEGARTVEALRLGPQRMATGGRGVAEVYGRRMATLRLRSVLFPVAEASYGVPVAVVLLIGGLLIRGTTGVGTVVAAALYLQQAIEPLDQLLMWMENAQRGAASFARVLGVGLVPPEPGGTAGPGDRRSITTAGPGGRQSITVRGLRFAYPGGADVLHGVDLVVRPGERLAVVGPSGAGKSTLARLLAGVDTPREGSVTLGGVSVVDLDPASRRRHVVLVTQEHHVFIGTLRDNLALAAPHATDDQIRAALDAVGAGWHAGLPGGLDTLLGAGNVELSAAEAQQLALARVALADPHTLILDEATAALDPTTARRTERALAAVLAGRTVIAIAHRLNTAHDADRVAVLSGGRITELGSHDELLAGDGGYARLWRSWHG